MAVDFMEGFASRLAQLRGAFGVISGRPNLSMAAFSTQLGLEHAAYSRYERGEMQPTLQTLVNIRRLTGVSLDYLVAGEAPGIPQPSDLVVQCHATFAERIRWVRELFVHETAQVARAMEVSSAVYELWESGREPMPEAKFAEFAHRFSVSLDYLVHGLSTGIAPIVLQHLLYRHPTHWHAPHSHAPDTDTETLPGTTGPQAASADAPAMERGPAQAGPILVVQEPEVLPQPRHSKSRRKRSASSNPAGQ